MLSNWMRKILIQLLHAFLSLRFILCLETGLWKQKGLNSTGRGHELSSSQGADCLLPLQALLGTFHELKHLAGCTGKLSPFRCSIVFFFFLCQKGRQRRQYQHWGKQQIVQVSNKNYQLNSCALCFSSNSPRMPNIIFLYDIEPKCVPLHAA
jgi:hypothetical protein